GNSPPSIFCSEYADISALHAAVMPFVHEELYSPRGFSISQVPTSAFFCMQLPMSRLFATLHKAASSPPSGAPALPLWVPVKLGAATVELRASVDGGNNGAAQGIDVSSSVQ